MKAIFLGLACLASTSGEAAFVVSKAPTANVACEGGVCAATAADAVLDVKELRARLKEGDLTLRSGAEAQDIVTTVRLTLSGPHSLTLDSWAGIDIGSNTTVTGSGPVMLITRDGGAEGNLAFSGKGRLTFRNASGQLFVNGKRFTLVSSIAALALAAAQDPQASIALSDDFDASLEGTFVHAPVPATFDGTLEGLGHQIRKLTIAMGRTKEDTALFRALGAKANVRNLHLVEPSVTREATNGGYIVAPLAAANAGNIRNVDVGNATVSILQGVDASRFEGCAAGLVGVNTGLVNKVQIIAATVLARGVAGGIACRSGGTITLSGASADVSNTINGGAAGIAYENTGTIRLSWSKGAIASNGTYKNFGSSDTGGLVAVNRGTIESSWTSATVHTGSGDEDTVGESYALGGGFAGANSGTIRNSYALGAVEAGFMGEGAGFVDENARTTGVVEQSYTLSVPSCYAAGCQGHYAFVRRGSCPNGTADYWKAKDPHGSGDCSGLSGLTAEEFKAELPAGFDPAIWSESDGINHGYPYLLANPPE